MFWLVAYSSLTNIKVKFFSSSSVMSMTQSKYDSSRYVNLILLLKNNSPIVCQCGKNFIGKNDKPFNPKFEFIHILKDIHICQIEE